MTGEPFDTAAFEAFIHDLLDGAHPPGHPVTHSPDCAVASERCLAHSVLQVHRVEHDDALCNYVTLICWRWLQVHEETVR